MKELLIIVGVSGSGKTTFAKKYAREKDGEYLDFDLIFNYQTYDFGSFIDKLAGLVNSSQKNLIVLDGYIPYRAPSPEALGKKLNIQVRLGMCFAAPHLIAARQKEKVRDKNYKNVISEEQIREKTVSLFTLVSFSTNTPFLIDTSATESGIVPQAKFSLRWQELLFVSDLDKASYDKYYQDIFLPSGVNVFGYSHSEETWKRLNALVDFKGKSVIDFGPFHGFMSFKAEEVGASKVVGVEKHDMAIDTVRRIGWIKQSSVLFLKGDIQDFETEELFDISLVLNMLHYASNTEKALLNVFAHSNTVIFEINIEQEEVVRKVGAGRGFELKAEINSEREGRKIIVLQSAQALTPIKSGAAQHFSFSLKKYRRQKALHRVKSFKILVPVRYVYRKLKKFLGLYRATHSVFEREK